MTHEKQTLLQKGKICSSAFFILLNMFALQAFRAGYILSVPAFHGRLQQTAENAGLCPFFRISAG